MLAAIGRGLDAILFLDLPDDVASSGCSRRAESSAVTTTRPR